MEYSKPTERVLISFDYALKRLLRNKANYEILEGFLSELLMRDIIVKNIGESESNKEHAGDKYNRVDVLVEDEDGEILLIELQFSIEMDFLQRMLFGTSKALTERMLQGDEYLEVKKIYSINIVYFDLGQGEDYVYHGKTHFKGLHCNDELRLSKAQRNTFGKEMAGDLYPEYYILKINNFNDAAKDTLDEWIYFLKHNAVRDDFTAKGLDKAREVLDREKLTIEERRAYEYVLNQRSHDVSMIASSKLEGRIEGLEEGRIEREKLAKDVERLAKDLEKEREEREKEREELEAALAELRRLKGKN
ncbi:MAG: Rpn family recombination-promoting nuclease/putative transposase [Dysgonamonadaceae bacterium]|jgi:predicted transposase/invertase (TIGR01784 family)|nr:Rpn family recombination-promoting nuclease/putative transposase [Dysgonamonadaceae bacterium]